MRPEQSQQAVGVLRHLVIETLANARRQKREPFEEALDVRITIGEPPHAQELPLVRMELGELLSCLVEVAHLLLIVPQDGVAHVTSLTSLTSRPWPESRRVRWT